MAVGSPAEKAALKPGDRVLLVDGLLAKNLTGGTAAYFATKEVVSLIVWNPEGQREVRLGKVDKGSYGR